MSKLTLRLSGEERKYLEEVWGYSYVEDVDDMTWRCIQENADDGYELDTQLIKLREELRIGGSRCLA